MLIPWLLLLATIEASSSTMNISQMESLLSQYDSMIASIMAQSTAAAPTSQAMLTTAPNTIVAVTPVHVLQPGPYATQTHFTGHMLAAEGATAINDIEFDAIIDHATISSVHFSTLTQIPIYQTATVTATQTVTQTPTGNFYQNIGMLDYENDPRSKSEKLKKKKKISKQRDSDSEASDCDTNDSNPNQKSMTKISNNKQKLRRFGDEDGFKPDFRIDDIEIELLNFDKEEEADNQKVREKKRQKYKQRKHKKQKQEKRKDVTEDADEKLVHHKVKTEKVVHHKVEKEIPVHHKIKEEKPVHRKIKEETKEGSCIKVKTEILHWETAAKPTPTACCVQFAETKVKTVTHVSVIPVPHTDYRVYTDRVIVPKTEILTRVEYAPYRVTKTITDTMYMMRPTSGGGCGCELAANGMILPANQLPPGIYATPVDQVDRSRYEIVGFAGHDAVNNLRPL